MGVGGAGGVEVGLGAGGGGGGAGGWLVVGTAVATIAVGVGVRAGSQICWPMLSKIFSRQLTCIICSTVVSVASLREDKESLA